MLLEEEFEKALSLKEEPKSSLLMIDLVLLARSENISDKEIKATLQHLFVKYYEEGENNNEESRDKADTIADLLDAIEYDRVWNKEYFVHSIKQNKQKYAKYNPLQSEIEYQWTK